LVSKDWLARPLACREPHGGGGEIIVGLFAAARDIYGESDGEDERAL
jgi:hypothetical protein